MHVYGLRVKCGLCYPSMCTAPPLAPVLLRAVWCLVLRLPSATSAETAEKGLAKVQHA